MVQLEKANDGIHKYIANFKDGRKTRFGAVGYDDYTLKHDVEQRDRYRNRHQKDLNTKDPHRAGFLSYYILWGNSTSLATNIASYTRRFGI
jgi:hypothetical protein